MRLALDGGEPLLRTVNNVVVANARYFGGGMKVAPDADMSDGLFDVVLIGDLGTVELARGMGAVYRGEHIGRRGIEVFQAREVVAEAVDADAEVLIDMDGDSPVGSRRRSLWCRRPSPSTSAPRRSRPVADEEARGAPSRAGGACSTTPCAPWPGR
ncbi:MAG: hypothetical protein R3F43_22325 [bacterium]